MMSFLTFLVGRRDRQRRRGDPVRLAVILLHPPLHLVGVSIGTERESVSKMTELSPMARYVEAEDDDTIRKIACWHGVDDTETLKLNKYRIRGLTMSAKLQKGTRCGI